MITPVKEKFTIFQGQTWVQAYRVWDSEDEAVRQPVNITGCTARLVGRKKVSDADPPLVDIAGIILGPQGEVQFVFPDDQTAAATWAVIGFDSELYWPDGHTDKLSYGTMSLVKEYTR
jgi:hypothetical protein